MELDIRAAHPIEDVGYGLSLIVSRKGYEKKDFVRLRVEPLSVAMHALSDSLVVEKSIVSPHVDPHTLSSSSWKNKLANFSHSSESLVTVRVNQSLVSDAYRAWYGETDPLIHALQTPDKQLPRDFWSMIIHDALSSVLTVDEQKMIISTI